MGARRFGPDAQSFLQPDSYAGALANLGLSMDPLTGNRYGLAGGNPVSFVEVDGHRLRENGAGTGYRTPTTGNYSGVDKLIPGNPAYRGAYSGETMGDVLRSVASVPVGVAKGFGQAGWETLQAGGQVLHAAGSCVLSPIECRDNVWAFGSAVWNDPGGFVGAVVESAIDGTVKRLAEGKFSEAAGHGLFSLVGFGAVKAAKEAAAARATWAGSSVLREASEAAFRAADDLSGFTVKAKHLPGASGGWAKFGYGVDPRAAVRQALTSEGAVFAPNPQIPATFRVTTDLGYSVGTRGETGLRVVVGYDGRIITAFPVKP